MFCLIKLYIDLLLFLFLCTKFNMFFFQVSNKPTGRDAFEFSSDCESEDNDFVLNKASEESKSDTKSETSDK